MSVIGRKRLLSVTIRDSLIMGYPIIDMKIKRSQIDTSFIPVGIFFVHITTEYDTTTYTRKFYDFYLFNNELSRLRYKYPNTIFINKMKNFQINKN
jgi:hypothetical protein